MAAPMRYADWVRRFEDGSATGPLFLCGPETLLRDAIVDRVRERLFPSAEEGRLGHERCYGGETPLSAVTSSLASTGLFSSARLVTLADAERCGRSAAADRRELVERLKETPGPSVFIAFSDLPVRDLERKNEFTKALLAACTVVELDHPGAAGAMRWLLDECHRRGIRLLPAAAEFLLSRIGPDLQELSRELEKLELSTASGESVGEEEIRELVRRGQLGTGWEFCEAVLSGNGRDSLRLWDAVRRSEPALRTQWLIQRQARMRLSRAGGDEERLGRTLLEAYTLEWRIKSGRIPSGMDGVAMEFLAASLAAPRAASRGAGSRPRGR